VQITLGKKKDCLPKVVFLAFVMSLLSLETKEGRGRLGDAVVDWC